MKNRDLLMSLLVPALLWFCLAFSCGSGNRGDGVTTTPTRRTGQNTGGGAPTEQEVKDHIAAYWTKCQSYEVCKVTFDGPIRINPRERHTFRNSGGITVDAYPVKVDFSSYLGNKGTDTGGWVRHRGGIYYFYRNSFGEWESAQEGETTSGQ
jgi:hypothetical protein